MGRRKSNIRVFKSKRRKKATVGQVIRVSDVVHAELMEKRSSNQSWDVFFRKMLGLPDRYGKQQNLIEGVLEVISGKLLLKVPGKTWDILEEDAYEIAFLTAAKRGMKKISRPIKMREIV